MISKKPKGLGRGLEALLGGSSDFTNEATAVTEASLSLPVAVLQPGKYQPRTYMDETALNELADSIRAQGLLQALLVRPISDGKMAQPMKSSLASGDFGRRNWLA